MILVDTALASRAREGNPIRVGMVGAGYMGKAMTQQIIQGMDGLDVVAIANRTTATAHAIFEACGVGEKVDEVCNQRDFDAALAAGWRVVTSDARLLAAAPSIEAMVEATGEVEYGAGVAEAAIEGGKHLILVNAELDATVGPILKVMADRAGVVISNADGDEPAVAMNMVRFVRTIGCQPVLAGNIKGFYDRKRNPHTQIEFSRKYDQRPKKAASFADGTKLSMEASVLANATGFSVVQRGMTGPRCAHVKDVLDLFDLDSHRNRPIVDFVLGAEPGSGAFVVGYEPDAERRKHMQYFKMGDGPFYVFYRPFHLTHLEAPLSVARAVLFGDAAIAPLGGPRTEVVAYSKVDLEAGTLLDGIGGFTCYGMVDNFATAKRANALPMGLTEGCVVKRPIAADTMITRADVEVPDGRVADRLRNAQDSYFL